MKRALMNASVASMIYYFNMDNINILEELGYKVDVACSFGEGNTIDETVLSRFRTILRDKDINVFETDCPRDIFSIKKIIRTYKQLKKIAQTEKYDIVHTQSPIGGVLCRLAFRKARKTGTKVIYTAHGFHFYKGAPLKNWLIYYPIEKICSCFCDVLITINKEDYLLAQKKMKAKQVEYVPGVGIDLAKFGQATVDKSAKRKELGIPEEATLLLSVGELNENKNHETVIRAIKDVEVYYVIAGRGGLQEHLQRVINDLGMTEKVKLLGFRADVAELYQAADVYVLPSVREGLNVSVMEAMASGLPVVCSRIRGNTDLIDENGGALFDPHSIEECEKSIEHLLNTDLIELGAHNTERIKEFEIGNVCKIMKDIYFKEG